jgi:NAD(P)H-flavin reductase
MWQLIQRVLSNPEDATKLNLVYCNKTSQDVLMKLELDSLAERFPDRLKITYLVESPSEDWSGSVGRVSLQHIGQPKPRSLVMVCGPDGYVS